ncbi:hypothetical protein G3A_14195 [Bacillus sp. 17376]|uniref:Uncharacterized protein n=1 Tax=Mesobacillus boroniphilus JCM 21738 TaxID=1294265 RepID=W4RUQ3_9BACI|nr:hypothetical protein [Mesobacillus boroniphilus]ESU31902.1 hypothetical protein G3A_14195 [Bacillus sp. 17376]GAE47598.1 hypothetical protein JCM21738_4595 [Mesobacillus boroniphilus JCM 21738]
MWLNVDIPTKKVTIHEDDCPYIPKGDSKYKKLNGLLRDGGWLNYKNREEALLEYEHNYREYERGYCFTCDNRKAPTKNLIDSTHHLSEDVLLDLREESGNVSWQYTASKHGFEEEED